MDALTDATANSAPARRSLYRRITDAIGDQMPKGLYARALIIIIAPMVLLQSVLTFVFLERHWQTVTRRLSTVTVQNIAMLIDIYKNFPQDPDATTLTQPRRNRSRLTREFRAGRGTADRQLQAVLRSA